MAGSIVGTLDRIKGDPLKALGRDAVEAVCDELGYAWRDRTLDPATTLALFVQQVLNGNCPCSEVRHLAAGGTCQPFTPGAYCQARARLPLPFYQAMVTRIVDAALPLTKRKTHRWRGRHRVFHVDGSTFSMPDTPALQQAFGQPAGQAEGCGFPTAHVLFLFSTTTGPAGNAVTLTMVTTLLDPVAYPADGGDGDEQSLLDLRLRRWDVETNIRHMKTTMKMDVLRCKSEAGILKELCVFCIVYNLVRVTMLEAARRQHTRVDRISFADTYKWLRHARPGDRLPDLLVNPHRPNRAEPRVVKRRAKPHDLMNKPRDELRKRLKSQAKNA